MSGKPTLPMGWSLSDGVKIKKRVDQRFFVEIFLLENNEYYYVFHDPEVQEKITKWEIPHECFSLSGERFVAQRLQNYSPEQLIALLDEIRNPKGLEAVAGMDELKKILIRDIIHPLQNKALYEKYKVTIPNGVLFFGAPGCGKTYIARKLAEALRRPLFEIRESDIGSPFIHETSKNIGAAFATAQSSSPAVLFFDEISSLVPKRENLGGNSHYKEAEISEFLTQLEGAGTKGILVIGATNFPERIDSAILRAGRMDKRIFIPPPDYSARTAMFKLMLDGRPVEKEVNFELLGKATEGFVSSDIQLIIENAARVALTENKPIGMVHLQQQIECSKPSITPDEIQRYSKLMGMERK